MEKRQTKKRDRENEHMLIEVFPARITHIMSRDDKSQKISDLFCTNNHKHKSSTSAGEREEEAGVI